MGEFDADVAVVGLGAWGAAALWRLAARGVDVIGFEQYRPGHALGSSHGGSRMFRTACMEHPGLVELARLSGELWRELESVAGEGLFVRSGGLLAGPRDGRLVSAAREVVRAHRVSAELLDAAEIRRRFPAHAGLGRDDAGIWEPDAGLIRPEAAVRAGVAAGETCGARVFAGTEILGLRVAGRAEVVLRTAVREFRVRQVVVTAGPWLSALVPGASARAVRMPATWFAPKAGAEDAHKLEQFPVFMRELADGSVLWGHGATNWDDRVKLGLEDHQASFERVAASDVDRALRRADWEPVAARLPDAVPGLEPVCARGEICLYAETPDGQFLLGRTDPDGPLIVGGGCCSHGFKHATGVGEVLAALVVGERPVVDVGFMDPRRFGR